MELVQIGLIQVLLPLVDPASVLGEGIQLIVSDEVGFKVLFPVANTLRRLIFNET